MTLQPRSSCQRHREWNRPTDRWVQERLHIPELTERECQVLALLGLGHDNRQISHSLQIHERTVKLHITHILRKLGVLSRLQAGLVAAEHTYRNNTERQQRESIQPSRPDERPNYPTPDV